MEDMEALPVRFPTRQHNHSSCVNKLLGDAEEECRRQKLRFTEHRRKVLEIIASSHKPLGAYDILDKMNFSGRRQAPVVAYRALDFLINLGLFGQSAFVVKIITTKAVRASVMVQSSTFFFACFKIILCNGHGAFDGVAKF